MQRYKSFKTDSDSQYIRRTTTPPANITNGTNIKMDAHADRVEQQFLVTKLLNGTATQEERDKALATVMLSLWGQRELKELIRMVHNEECSKCPLKSKHLADNQEKTWQKITMTLLQYGGWLILIIAGLLKISVK